MQVRRAERTDIRSIVRVHRKAFSGFYLDKMGPAFLRIYYQCALNNASVIALVSAEESGELNGFVIGFKDPVSFYAEFKAERAKLIFPILLALIKRPWLLIPSIANIFRVSNDSAIEDTKSYTELVSIGVSAPGVGAGSALLESFLSVCWADNVNTVILTTNRDNNDSVNKFYLKHDFRCVGVEYRNNRVLNRYVMERPVTGIGDGV